MNIYCICFEYNQYNTLIIHVMQGQMQKNSLNLNNTHFIMNISAVFGYSLVNYPDEHN